MKLLVLALALVFAPVTQAYSQNRKPTVAVVQIDDLARTGHAETLSKMIETAVAGTGKFRLVERESLGKLVGEQVRSKGGMVTTNRPGKVGGFEGVDYLIYGAITSVGSRKSENLGSTFVQGLLGNKGASCQNKSSTLGLDVKITDAETGEIRFVKQLNETQRSAASCSGDASIDLPLLLRQAANHVASGLVTSIYPMLVAATMPDGNLVLNYGEGSVEAGEYYDVFLKGNEIRDPSTGDVIANDETKLGLIRITSVTGRISKAVLVGAFTSGVPVGAVVRPADPFEVQAALKAAKKR